MSDVIVITGDRNSGKTTAVLKLKEAFPVFKGFLSISEGKKDEITLLDTSNGNSFPLMSRYFDSSTCVGSYHYLQSTFDYVNSRIFTRDDYVIIDEVGRLEVSGNGFEPLIKKLLSLNINMVITVRGQFLGDVERRYGIKSICFSPDEIHSVIEKIKNLNPDRN